MASRELALGQADAFSGTAAAERGLVELCRRGDAEAFARLVSLHESMVYNLSARLLGDGEEARDLSQDVFLQVYRTLGRFEGRSSLKTWIYRIVVNQARNRQRWWRRRHRERCCPLEDMTAADHAQAAAGRPDAEAPFERLARGERARMIQAALLKLSFDHRAILTSPRGRRPGRRRDRGRPQDPRGHGQEPAGPRARLPARGDARSERRHAMTCRLVRARLSAHRDGALAGAEHHRVAAHLDACRECARHWRSLNSALDALAEVPRLECSGEIAARIFDRIDMENRKPGLATLFRPLGTARPFMLPSLVPAFAVVATVILGALEFHRPEPLPPVVQQRQIEAWTTLPSPVPDWGTERHPLFAHGDIGRPRAQPGNAVPSYLLEPTGEGTVFLETVVARDGTVSAVNLIGGDSEDAAPLLEALRHERFEPVRFRGRPVAVSVYRLISRMEVRAPIT